MNDTPDFLELEKTYLAKRLPEGLGACEHKEVLDIYIPGTETHPVLRIRKDGDRFMITKKQPKAGDVSEQLEQTILLTKKEFEVLSGLDGKRVRKIRYFYDYKGRRAEVDVFKDDLEGLTMVDFEFEDPKDKDSFEMPDFCLADVTSELFLAGGMLCGKKYADIEGGLAKFNYSKL